MLLVARALRDPFRLPWLLKDIFNLCIKEEDQREMRLCLIRVQVQAELMMNQDIQRYQQRRYVAQVIEILLFNELLLAPREPVEEGEWSKGGQDHFFCLGCVRINSSNYNFKK